MNQRWDIFCKIVDNFGDIGVCWRLARQLQLEHGLYIRLWIDDLRVAQALIPSLDIDKNVQICDEIILLKWDDAADFGQAAEVVIEAFSCELPPAYLAAMVQKKTKWVNLEYLSAEPWVDDFHAKPSPQPNGLTRYFYFPGFTEKTGGLIRESDIFQSNKKNHHYDESQNPASLTSLDSDFRRNDERGLVETALKISLFCYPFAPIYDLLDALQINIYAVCVYVPQSAILPKVAEFFDKKSVEVGDKLTKNNLTVEILPFLSQAAYDQLLRDCDLNFVRGEDSWIRAIWAEKPFIWQPYIQDENTHMKKLEAFLNIFYTHYEKKHLPCEAHRYWSAGQLPKDVLNAYLDDLKRIQVHTRTQSMALASQSDLAAKLVIFCNKL